MIPVFSCFGRASSPVLESGKYHNLCQIAGLDRSNPLLVRGDWQPPPRDPPRTSATSPTSLPPNPFQQSLTVGHPVVDGSDGHNAHPSNPALQGLLSRAAESPTVHSDRDGDGVNDAHRERVYVSAEHTLTQHADLLQRLKDADGVGDVAPECGPQPPIVTDPTTA
jgi:hypothetical protein